MLLDGGGKMALVDPQQAVSGLQQDLPLPATPQEEQAEALIQPLISQYTQCIEAYPRLLQTASDPGLQEGSPVFHIPSYGT